MELSITETLIGRGLTQSPLPVIVFDPALRIAWANGAAQAVSRGTPTAEWRGRRLLDVLPGIDAASIEQSLRHVLATGEPVADLEVGQADGDRNPEQFWNCVQFRFAGPDGGTGGAIHVMREVTKGTQDRQRLALTDEASARIGTTLDTARTAEELLEVAIPRLADAGAVDLLNVAIDGTLRAGHAADEMHLQRVAVRWPSGRPVPADYARSNWLDTDPTKPYHQRLVACLPTFVPDFGAMSTEEISYLDSGVGFAPHAGRAGGRGPLIDRCPAVRPRRHHGPSRLVPFREV